jgi:hypothetical protein
MPSRIPAEIKHKIKEELKQYRTGILGYLADKYQISKSSVIIIYKILEAEKYYGGAT